MKHIIPHEIWQKDVRPDELSDSPSLPSSQAGQKPTEASRQVKGKGQRGPG